MIDAGYTEVFLSLVLVAIAIAVGRWWKIPVQKEIIWGTFRTFIQLVAVGYALEFIFNLDNVGLIFAVIMIMISVGAHTVSGRTKNTSSSFIIAFISITIGSLITLGLMLLLRIITLEARFIIPLAGMIISNSMNASTLTINRIASDIKTNRLRIETALALGKTWREASKTFQQDAVIAGMTMILNFMKTAGIVALPGAMTGMILAGAEPVKAVLLQVIVGYMLLSSVSISSVIALELTVRKYFTPHQQLKIDV